MARFLVLGASGRTGRHIVEQALAGGDHVTALVRRLGEMPADEHLTEIHGTPQRLHDMQRALIGANAVAVALNNARASEWPWARPISPPTLLADSVRNALTAMDAAGVRRIVVVSAVGVGDSRPAAPALLRLLVRCSTLRRAYTDHETVDALIRGSDTDWTLVRPVRFDDVRLEGGTLAVGRPAAGSISRRQVAAFVLDCLRSGAHVRATPIISSR